MKLYPPLGNKIHRVTQTYHGELAGNPADMSKQIAVDFSAVRGTPAYAVADGIITNTTTTRGGYCTLDCGLPFYFLYVHTEKWLPIGTRVKRGQKIAEVNADVPQHLHFGVKMKDGSEPVYGLMEYVDRSTVFGAGFPKGSWQYNEILNAWFESDQKIRWELFADIDPFDKPVQGNRYEYLRDTNVRSAPTITAKINGLARKGAVGEVKESGTWFADGYEWIFLNLHSIEGYSVKKNVARTDKPKTTPDAGSITPPVIPDDCDEQVEYLNGEISRLRKDLGQEQADNEVLQKKIEYENELNINLSKEMQAKDKRIADLDRKITELNQEIERLRGGEEELGLVKRFIAWVKSVWSNS